MHSVPLQAAQHCKHAWLLHLSGGSRLSSNISAGDATFQSGHEDACPAMQQDSQGRVLPLSTASVLNSKDKCTQASMPCTHHRGPTRRKQGAPSLRQDAATYCRWQCGRLPPWHCLAAVLHSRRSYSTCCRQTGQKRGELSALAGLQNLAGFKHLALISSSLKLLLQVGKRRGKGSSAADLDAFEGYN